MAHVDQEQTSNLASSRRSQDGRTSSSAGSSWASLHADDFGFVLIDNEVCACLSQVSQDSAQTGCRDAAAASTSSRGRASTTTPPSAEETAMKSRPATRPARLVSVDERHPPSPCFDFAPEQSDHGPQSHNTQPDDQPSGCWARSRSPSLSQRFLLFSEVELIASPGVSSTSSPSLLPINPDGPWESSGTFFSLDPAPKTETDLSKCSITLFERRNSKGTGSSPPKLYKAVLNPAIGSHSDSISSQALTPKRSSRDCRSTISSTPKPRHALLHQGAWGCSMPDLFQAGIPSEHPPRVEAGSSPCSPMTPDRSSKSLRKAFLSSTISSVRLGHTSKKSDTMDLGSLDRVPDGTKARDIQVDDDLPRAHIVFEAIALPKRDEAAFSRGAALLDTLDLNPFNFCPEDLIHLVLEIFDRLELPMRLGLDRFRLEAFVMCVRHSMRDSNSYHSWIHVFDVTHTVYVLARDSGMMDTLHDIDRFALIVAALCHDLDHPGFSNMNLASPNGSLGSFDSNQSSQDCAFNPRDKLLEKHHSLRAFEIMVSLNIDLLHGLSTHDFYSFRRTVESVILATDMTKHASFIAETREHVSGAADDTTGDDVPARRTSSSEACQAEARKILGMQILLKAADISNVIKPFHVAARWAVCVTDEFFNQGRLERKAGLPVSPNCDETTVSRVGLQRGFIDFLARPFFVVVADMFPKLKCLLFQIDENRRLWDGYTQEKLLDEYAVSARRWHKPLKTSKKEESVLMPARSPRRLFSDDPALGSDLGGKNSLQLHFKRDTMCAVESPIYMDQEIRALEIDGSSANPVIRHHVK